MAVYALVRRYSGPVGAASAAGLMEFCFLAIYFARLPVSEVGCQFFMLASPALLCGVHVDEGPRDGARLGGRGYRGVRVQARGLILSRCRCSS